MPALQEDTSARAILRRALAATDPADRAILAMEANIELAELDQFIGGAHLEPTHLRKIVRRVWPGLEFDPGHDSLVVRHGGAFR